ncbi:MAG: amidohydrolase family protein [Armatimonadetes bacterium]|nr:amidohydrolase family protein [Armatimonadota bacterium]
MILRPQAIFLDGELRHGLEVEIESGIVTRIGPHSGMPDLFVLSPAFVNAHSHLEYRGMQGKLNGIPYPEWLFEVAKLKSEESPLEVEQACLTAALENLSTGVALIAEHSDRPGSGAAMRATGLQGHLFQEVITVRESHDPAAKLASINEKRARQANHFPGITLTPHALFTVDAKTLTNFAHSPFFSIHFSEHITERQLYSNHAGPLAEFYKNNGLILNSKCMSPLEYMQSLGILNGNCQLVHCCDVRSDEVLEIGKSGAVVAHCPRSNETLGCSQAPVRQFLSTGVKVGLGMDSAASSGPIDMFAEMRAALDVSRKKGEYITAEEVWTMATTMGAESLGYSDWTIRVGSTVPLIKIEAPSLATIDHLIESSKPSDVSFVEGLTPACLATR